MSTRNVQVTAKVVTYSGMTMARRVTIFEMPGFTGEFGLGRRWKVVRASRLFPRIAGALFLGDSK